MGRDNILRARLGEDEACSFLKKNNYKILERNFRCCLGEVDIIARDKDTICFIEVKTRSSDAYGLPEEAVNKFKQKKIAQVALLYLKNNGLLENSARFDVVSVHRLGVDTKICLIKNAFEAQC